MEDRFIIPAVTFLSGLFVWIALFVFYLVSDAVPAWMHWIAIAVCLLVAGLILFSAARCRKVGGPKIGGTIRASVLAVLSVLTFWKIGTVAASLLLLASVIIFVTGSAETEAPEHTQ